jgi:hypothetical protein
MRQEVLKDHVWYEFAKRVSYLEFFLSTSESAPSDPQISSASSGRSENTISVCSEISGRLLVISLKICCAEKFGVGGVCRTLRLRWFLCHVKVVLKGRIFMLKLGESMILNVMKKLGKALRSMLVNRKKEG